VVAARKITVEECLVLDVCKLARKGLLRQGRKGTLTWRRGTSILALVLYETDDDIVYLPLIKWGDFIEREHHGLDLVRTPGSTYGGERVWFFCAGCLEPVRKLYLPPKRSCFLCRTCHHLSYESRQERFANPFEQAGRKVDAMGEMLTRLEAKQARAGGHQLPPVEQEAPTSIGFAGVESSPTLTPAKRPRGRPREKRPYHRRSPLPSSEPTGDGQAYCVKCRDFRDMTDPQPVTFSNGRAALQGTCPICLRKLARIVKAS
jgi:Domain of unknown function (DUF5679)